MLSVTQSVYIGDHVGSARRRSATRWVTGNIAVVLGVVALSAPLVTTEQDPSLAMAAVVSLCFFGPMRAFSGALEWYLTGQYAYRSLVVAHLAGGLLGLLMWFSPQEAIAPNGEQTLGNGALALFAYLLTTFAALALGAIVAVIRTARRGAPPPAPARRQPHKAFSALFWFNTVFIVVVGIVIAPGMAAQDNSTLAYGFAGGLIVAVLLRMPGVGAEWLLTKRGLHRFVYGLHLLSAVLAVLIVLTPAPESEAPFDPVGGGVGIYLMLTSMTAWLVLACAVPLQVWRRRSTAPAEGSPAPAPVVDHRLPPAPVFRATATVPPLFPTPAETTTSFPLPAPGNPSGSTETKDRTDRLRNEVGMAIGIVAGLASLAQGYDGEQILQTVVVAALVGGGGLGAFYVFTRRR